MGTQILINLPEKTYRRAERLAQLTSRGISDVLADTLELSLPALDDSSTYVTPVADLSDDEVLALSELQMTPEDDAQLSAMLHKQQANSLSESEKEELVRLMQTYQEGLLHKAQTLAEAVKRGLRPPLSS